MWIVVVYFLRRRVRLSFSVLFILVVRGWDCPCDNETLGVISPHSFSLWRIVATHHSWICPTHTWDNCTTTIILSRGLSNVPRRNEIWLGFLLLLLSRFREPRCWSWFYKATTVMMMMIMAGQRIEYSECLAGWWSWRDNQFIPPKSNCSYFKNPQSYHSLSAALSVALERKFHYHRPGGGGRQRGASI